MYCPKAVAAVYKNALIAVCDGGLCRAEERDGAVVMTTKENGKIVSRRMTRGGKVFGARVIGYADACFDFPFADIGVAGEDIVYEDKTGNDT